MFTKGKTLALIKPDAMKNKYLGRIVSILDRTYTIEKMEMFHLNETQAKEFYKEHIGKPFFEANIKHMISGPIVAVVLSGKDDIIHRFRTLLGATDPRKSTLGSLRRIFGEGLPNNAIHGSDSEKSANREINFFFGSKYKI